MARSSGYLLGFEALKGIGYGMGAPGEGWLTTGENHYLSTYVNVTPGNSYNVVVAAGNNSGIGQFFNNGFVLIAYGGDI